MGFVLTAKSSKLGTSLLAYGRFDMRTMITGFSGWVRMQDGRSESVKVVDTAITVIATLLAAATWAMLHH